MERKLILGGEYRRKYKNSIGESSELLTYILRKEIICKSCGQALISSQGYFCGHSNQHNFSMQTLGHTEFRALALQLPHSEQMNPDGVH